MNINLLKKYKAKPGEKTIYEHNEDLLNILNQLNFKGDIYKTMEKVILYHDIGKVVDSFQYNIESRHREIRHELLSASVKDLTDIERFAILTHHKSLAKVREGFKLYKDVYLKEIQEVEDKLGIEMIDIQKNVNGYVRNIDFLTDIKTFMIKGTLNYCDHLGSSNIKNIYNGFNAKEIFMFPKYTSVQKKSAKSSEDMIIISPTGSGKTEASLLWAGNIDKNKDRKIFYILPYTASITAMYKRLNKEGIKTGMLHGKVNYFLHKQDNIVNTREEYQKYKYFTNQITISTIHQVFKAIFNCKFNEMLLSVYYNSTFVIDEIHCYDEKQLALILGTLKFLKDKYKISICIMSASIPSKLFELIKGELGINRIIKSTKTDNNKIRRHRVKYKDQYIHSDIELIKKCIKRGERALIVVNTVKQSQEMYRMISKLVNKEDISLLHSGFCTRDRDRVEGELSNKKVLIGTQTIEVSLDIDYDVMFTEISPIDSQIQRWGRINRKRVSSLKGRKMIYIYNTKSHIYDKNIIDRTRNILIDVDYINENDTQGYLDEVYKEDFVDYYEHKVTMDAILDNCKAGDWSGNDECNNFTNVNVIPESLLQEYEKYVDEKRFYDANSLFVSISEGKYATAVRENAIDIEKNVIYCDYNSEVGLKIGEYNKFF